MDLNYDEIIRRRDQAMAEGRKPKCLDWKKVAYLINDLDGACIVDAGIKEDYNSMSDTIYCCGEVELGHAAHTTSVWGTPVIEVYRRNGNETEVKTYEDFYIETDNPVENWTPKALMILETGEKTPTHPVKEYIVDVCNWLDVAFTVALMAYMVKYIVYGFQESDWNGLYVAMAGVILWPNKKYVKKWMGLDD